MKGIYKLHTPRSLDRSRIIISCFGLKKKEKTKTKKKGKKKKKNCADK